MAVRLAPIADVRVQCFDDQGNVLAGGKLFSYAAGSSTKQNTYTSSTGGVANANPIVLDADGRTPSGVWLTEGLPYKFILAPANDTDPPSSPLWTEDNVYGINDSLTLAADQWIASNLTPTYVSATSFTLVGDQTATFHIGRRLKTTNSGGTIYSRISNSVFGAVTTVTVVNDSGTLDSGLSAVSYGLLTATNHSIPVADVRLSGLTVAGNQSITGTLLVTGAITNSNLTASRVPLVGASGLLTSSATFTYTDAATARSFVVSGSGSVANVIHLANTHASGDAHYYCEANGSVWVWGVDASASGRWALGFNDVLGANDYIRVSTSGDVELPQGQLKFPATQNPSSNANTLDDYEEGTWTATLTDGTNNATMSDSDGRYVKIGRSCSVWADVATSSLGSVSGSIFVAGLPFTQTSGITSPLAVGGATGLAISAGHAVSAFVDTAATRITLEVWDNAAGDTAMQGAEWSADGACSFGGVMYANG